MFKSGEKIVCLHFKYFKCDQGNESESGSICAGKWSELRGKGLTAVSTDEDIDCLAVVSPWGPQHERDTPQDPILQCHGRKEDNRLTTPMLTRLYSSGKN